MPLLRLREIRGYPVKTWSLSCKVGGLLNGVSSGKTARSCAPVQLVQCSLLFLVEIVVISCCVGWLDEGSVVSYVSALLLLDLDVLAEPGETLEDACRKRVSIIVLVCGAFYF